MLLRLDDEDMDDLLGYVCASANSLDDQKRKVEGWIFDGLRVACTFLFS
jgi:hypothetical protein